MRHQSILAVACGLAALLMANCSGSPVAPSSDGNGGAVSGGGLPFGPMQLPISEFGQPPFTAAYINAGSADKIGEALSVARGRRIRLLVKLSESREVFQNADETFSLTRWKRSIDRLRSVDFESYVADGTVIGAELVSEPHDSSNWGGEVLSQDDLDAAAAYAKSIWPTLPVGAGRSDYAMGGAQWRHLDFSHSRYHMRKGPVAAWLRETVAEAQAARLALVLGLNFYAGEIGDSPMTASEVHQFGVALAREPYACALTGYIYDQAYFADARMMEAFAAVAAVAGSRSAPPCYVRAR